MLISLFCLFLVGLLPVATVAGEVRIGVPAHRGAEQVLQDWQPTADYLAARLPGKRVVVVPLDAQETRRAVAEGALEFVVANPALYVELEVNHGVTRTATLVNVAGGEMGTRFGSVIFTRADRTDIADLSDLAGKSFVAVDRYGFGGWLMARHELERQGVTPERFGALSFSGYPMDQVVTAVREGAVDAGCVRTGILEQMAAEGKIDLREFRVLHPLPQDGFPFLLSTPLYPEYAFARLRHVDNELVRRVTAQLLLMPSDSSAVRAARIGGWTTPLNYQPVHDLLRELREPPYETFGRVTAREAARQHWPWVLVTSLLLAAVAVTAAVALRLWARLKTQAEGLEEQVRARTAELAAGEARLRESEFLFRSQFDLGNIGIAIISPEKSWVRANPRLCAMLGYSEAELSRLPWDVISHPDDLRADRDQFERMLDGEIDDYELDTRFLHKDGEVLHVRMAVACYRIDRRVQFVIASFLDITQRVRAEAEIRTLNADLERRVAERTAQLEEANRELEAFSYSVSHDLRAPLRRIGGFSHALQEDCSGALSEECRGFLERIRAATDRMDRLIDAMLQLSRLTRKEFGRERIDLSSLAEEIVAELRGAEPQREVAVEIAGGMAVEGDRALVRVLLENLVSNAWKYSVNAPEARIEIGARHEEGTTVYFVRDNGAGFDPQFADKLFVPFQRLHGEREFEGVGIGLATVKRIVDRHGGRIWAESRPGEGATFSFTFGMSGLESGRKE